MFINITPVGKPRMTRRDRWAQRPAVVRYHAFCDELRIKYPYKLTGRLTLTFFLPMPTSWSQKKKDAMSAQPHHQKPDIDNLCKAVMDALAKDDSHIYYLCAEKRWSLTAGIDIV